MGRTTYGQLSGSDNKGTTFVTQGSLLETKSAIISLQAIQTAALTLETAVSAALAAAITGSSGVGSMDRNVKTSLSATFSAVTASIK
jgi:hypothetical protein